MVSSRSHTNTLWRGDGENGGKVIYFFLMSCFFSCLFKILLFNNNSFKIMCTGYWLSARFHTISTSKVTSRSLSGGGEGLFLRLLPRDLDPPLRQARSSSSLMGVGGLCTVSKSPGSSGVIQWIPVAILELFSPVKLQKQHWTRRSIKHHRVSVLRLQLSEIKMM